MHAMWLKGHPLWNNPSQSLHLMVPQLQAVGANSLSKKWMKDFKTHADGKVNSLEMYLLTVL